MGTKMKRNFSCIDFKQKAQERIYREITDLKPEEQREYFRSKAENGPLGEWWKKIKREAVISSKDQEIINETLPA